MPRKKVDEPQEQVEYVSPETLETYERIESLKEQFSDAEQGRARLYKKHPDGRITTLLSLPAQTFDPDLVGKKHGGGRYYVKFYKGSVYCGDANFEIDETVKPEPDAPLEVAPAATARGIDPYVAMLLGQMKGMEALAASQGVMMTAMLGALGKGGGGDSDKALDVGLKIAEIIKEASPRVPQGMGIEEMAKTFREGLSLGQSIVNPEKGFSDVIDSLVPPVTRVLESYAEKSLAAAPTAPQLPTGPRLVKSAQPEPTPTVDIQKAPWLMHLAPFLREIAAVAQQGHDPDAYVGYLLARIPDNLIEEIEIASRDEQFVANALAALPPGFRGYQGWVTKALEAIREQVKSDEIADDPQDE